jgi:hypothetical protein
MVDQKKEEFMSHIEHYRAVLDDLQSQRNELQYRIKEIDTAITSLHRLIPEAARNEFPTPAMPSVPSAVVPHGKYAGMSVRWAILNLLAEDATAPMTTGDIAEALLKGGIQTSGKSFSGNVSAVLSGMNHDRKEVFSNATGWVVTETGKSAWAHISAKRQAQQQQFTISANVQ